MPENEFDREFRRHEQSRIEERRIRQERQQRIDTLKIERNNIRGEINNILNSPLEAGMYGGLTAGRVYELKEQEKRITNQIGVIYLEQLMDYRVEGDYYVSNVDGVEIRMSKGNFDAPDIHAEGHKNTPINLATSRIDPRALVVLVENSQALNLDSVEVSSLWRNSTTSPHGSGRGIDIVRAYRGNEVAYFNNENGQAQTPFIQEIYNQFVGDNRVSQALGPWEFYGYGANPERHPNRWRELNLTSGDYYDHRHHLHITILKLR